MLPEQQQRILGYFIEEAKDHLNTIEQGLLNLQSTVKDSEMLNEIFRAAHSIKGGAAMLGLSSIQLTAHRLEDCFKVLKEHSVQVDQKLESLFLEVSDTLKALLDNLQGPFGLTEEIANQIMSKAEPVFQCLHEHLNLLVQQESSTVKTIGGDNWQKRQNQVMQILREMLHLFKQSATPEIRQNLQNCCQQLAQIGIDLNSPSWSNLCQSAARAIAAEENTFLTLAKIVITDIKKALELAVAGKESEITITAQLQALIPPQKFDFVDERTKESAPLAVFSSNVETTNTENLDFTTARSLPSANVQAENVITTNLGANQLSIETEDLLEFTADPQPIDSELQELEEEAPILGSFDTNAHGPEVGVAELSTLAQLFESDTPEFNETWDIEEEVIESAPSSNETETDNNESETEDISDDFVELLSLEGKTSISNPQATTVNEDLTLVNLFGNDFLEVENLESQHQQSSQIIPGIDVALPEPPVAHQFDSIDNPTPSHLCTNEPQGNLDDLFAVTENQDSLIILPSAQADWNLDDLLAQIEANSNSNFETNQGSEVDDFFDTVSATEATQEDLSLWTPQEDVEISVGGDDIIGDRQQLLPTPTIDLELEDLNVDFSPPQQQSDLMKQYGLEGPSQEELLPLLSTPAKDDSLAISISDRPCSNDNSNISADAVILTNTPESPTEIQTFQQLETLELTPEFTNSSTETLQQAFLKEDNDEHLIITELPPPELKPVEVDSTNTSVAPTDQLTQEPFSTIIQSDINSHACESQTSQTRVETIGDIETSIGLVDIWQSTEAELFENLKEVDIAEAQTAQNKHEPLTTEIEDTAFLELRNDTLAEINPTTEFGELVKQEVVKNTDREVTAEPEFAQLEDLLKEEVSKAQEISESEFAQLEDLLKEEVSKAQEISESEFAQLGQMLAVNQNEQDVSVAQSAAANFSPVSNKPVTSPDIDNEFRDLEGMVGGTITSSTVNFRGGHNSSWSTSRFEELMKVPVKHLDNLSNLVGELVVNRNKLEQDQERLRQSLDNLLNQVHQLSDVGAKMQELYERSLLEASLLASRKNSGFASTNTDRGFSELEMDRFTPFHILTQEIIELIVRVRESASDIDFITEETERVARQFRQVTSQLQDGLTKARMEPFSQATDLLPRGVRDNSLKYGKQVELVVQGRDTLIDKMILQHLKTPLTHLLNNAIAHGIETPSERQAKGKPPVGTITLNAFHQGNQTVISVSDDGAGIDIEAVKAKAMKVGLITPAQAQMMSPIEVYDLLFQPGFSTKDQADDLAGRGVGLDVVRTKISEIRGTITVDSTLGKGTTFTIRLPLTLSICKALCCVSERARIAFPMDSIEDAPDLPVKNIQQTADGQKFILWRDRLLPFKPLKELLTYNRQLSRGNVYGGNRDDDKISVIVVRSATTMVALQVDLVLSEQEIVIKQFEGPAPKPVGVAGATVLGDGRIMPIADVLEIIDIFQGRTSKQSAVSILNQKGIPGQIQTLATKIDPTVLIVDDSITVRELLSLTFSKAGYRVEQARDGQEAWDKLRSGLPCDLVFCDIEMPRCDGLELLSRIRKDPNLNYLPIAMLTSRGADKHRQMAISLGASGYFTKPYLEEALLEAASRMLKGEKLINTASTNA
jgi:chemotaxis protein histidine kinase CheA/ActR/RegA family two-component response regulator